MKQSQRLIIMLTVIGIALVSMIVIMAAGCSKGSPTGPVTSSMDNATAESGFGSLAKAVSVQNRHTQRLLAADGIVGTAAGFDQSGSPAIMVFVKDESEVSQVPSSLDNIPTVVEVTGEIHAFKVAPVQTARVSHTAKQTAPIKLGTSGGWSKDLANGYCCGGTLGSLITNGTIKFILSNYHVFQSDIVLGGNGDTANAGDPIIQPGLIDVNCAAASAQIVATLSSLSFPASLPSSNVDASIAEVVTGKVSATGEILEIGTISKNTVAASINKNVKKSGRTSGLTRSSVYGLNGSVKVTYDNECAGAAVFTKTFTGQIIVMNRGQSFLRAGDSGSLMVEDATTNPRAIGLLFAGSTTLAIANPINEVLNHFGTGFTMVGN
jgi:hypothetical protein